MTITMSLELGAAPGAPSLASVLEALTAGPAARQVVDLRSAVRSLCRVLAAAK